MSPDHEDPFDFGPITLSGAPRPVDGVTEGFCPRRIVLDDLLIQAASEAGAEVREAFTVDEVLIEDGVVTGIRGQAKDSAPVTERAQIVIGADGKHSLVAKAVRPVHYHEVPQLQTGYYAYWSGLPVEGFEVYIRAEHGRGFAAIPTHDDLTCVVGGWPLRAVPGQPQGLRRQLLRMLELAPQFAERLRAATRETRLAAVGDLRGFFRKPFGPGWALVGDAGYHKDPITAFGITDAFRDADAAATALDDVFAGRRAYDDAMAAWQQARDDESLPVYRFTCDFAKIEPPPAQMLQLLGTVSTNPNAMNDFVSVMAGTLPAPAFFAPDNVAHIMSEAHTAQPT